jgi:alpha-L-fucosidase 2
MDFLVKDPKTGWLVTSPSYSPEQGSLTTGPTMDEQLIRALMNSTIEAANILGKDREFVGQLAEVRNRLAPNQIGKHGQLQEWLTDVDTPNNNHRHMSPLWALYPGADINPNNPKIFDAAKLLLQWRGEGSTGWSYAWRIPLWARVGDGDYAFRELSGLLQKRTLPNLFDLCGPFQIDGNFGAPAGVAEMLLQSHYLEDRGAGATRRIVQLLPALPKAWPTGSVTGLRARGGFEVDIAWDKGVLTRAVVRSKLGNSCGLRYGDRTIDLATKAGKEYVFNGPQLTPTN